MSALPGIPGNLADYSAQVTTLVERGYRICGFLDAQPSEPDLILRHDIDMSVECALAMAEAEAAIGAVATYFVLLRSELYNPWSNTASRAIRRIAALGHEVGLHLDASLYPDDAAALDEACAKECHALEDITGTSVRIVSFHRPARALQGLDRPVGGRRHAYEPRFFEQMGYCSDSNGGWHHGHPLDHEAVRQERALQLLTHPVWWVADGDSAAARLDWFLGWRLRALEEALAANCRAHKIGWLERQNAC